MSVTTTRTDNTIAIAITTVQLLLPLHLIIQYAASTVALTTSTNDTAILPLSVLLLRLLQLLLLSLTLLFLIQMRLVERP